jgi:hypothetical protein
LTFVLDWDRIRKMSEEINTNVEAAHGLQPVERADLLSPVWRFWEGQLRDHGWHIAIIKTLILVLILKWSGVF